MLYCMVLIHALLLSVLVVNWLMNFFVMDFLCLQRFDLRVHKTQNSNLLILQQSLQMIYIEFPWKGKKKNQNEKNSNLYIFQFIFKTNFLFLIYFQNLYYFIEKRRMIVIVLFWNTNKRYNYIKRNKI